jgi:hypothetical protein
MPYAIVRVNDHYAVKSITTGKLHGLTTLAKAKAQKRVLDAAYNIEKSSAS